MYEKMNLSMAVVVRDDTVLIQRRYRFDRGFVFEFPGGAVDAEESAEKAAIRELNEETGMLCNMIIGKHTFENDYGGNVHFIILMGAHQLEPAQVDSSRQQTFNWYRRNKIPTTDLYRADKKFIETCLEIYI